MTTTLDDFSTRLETGLETYEELSMLGERDVFRLKLTAQR
jgi:hypothetical protein